MKTAILLVTFLFAISTFAGTVSGSVSYSGSETGMILVACIAEGDTAIVLEELTAITAIMAPGAYSITDDGLVGGVNYYAVAFMGIGAPPIPSSGSPAGVHPDPIVLVGDSATGADITLEETADVAGNIHYEGNLEMVYINIWDVYAEFTDSVPVLESTHFIGDTVYSLDLPSGPKRIQAFEDANGNSVLDAGESNAYATGPFGSMIIVGGGGVSDSGVDIVLPSVGIDEIVRPDAFEITVSPNPFNSACRIETPGRIEILDINGRIVRTMPGSGIWDGTDDSGDNLPVGTYLARVTYDGAVRTAKLHFVK